MFYIDSIRKREFSKRLKFQQTDTYDLYGRRFVEIFDFQIYVRSTNYTGDVFI